MNGANIESRGKVGLRIIDTTTVQVASEQHYIQQMRSAVQVGSAATFVVFTSIQSSCDDSFCINVVFTEVGIGVSTLKFGSGGFDINIFMDGVEISIIPDRTDVIFMDLISIAVFTTVTNQDGQSNVFFQIAAHNAIQPIDNIEFGDIDDIISM